MFKASPELATYDVPGVDMPRCIGAAGRPIVTPDTIIGTLKAREAELRWFGVRHIALFGSAARGNASEASPRLDQSIRDRHPTLPWRAIMEAANVYRHDYDNVAKDQV
jgi:hypothetical protein